MLGSKQQSTTHLFPTAWETGKPNSEVLIGLVLGEGLILGSWRTSLCSCIEEEAWKISGGLT